MKIWYPFFIVSYIEVTLPVAVCRNYLKNDDRKLYINIDHIACCFLILIRYIISNLYATFTHNIHKLMERF